MKNLLLATPTPDSRIIADLIGGLEAAGYTVVCSEFDGLENQSTLMLLKAFAGRSPDLLCVDLSCSGNLLPLHYIRRVLQHLWGTDLPLPCVSLFTPAHLALPDWPAATDDFVLPPYTLQETLARLSQLQFRKRHLAVPDTLIFADVRLDLAAHQARTATGSVLPLTPREYDLLQFLLTHRGKLFARNRLLDLVWGIEFEGGERTVDVHVRRLRSKLPPQAAALLETSRGFGYGFRLPS